MSGDEGWRIRAARLQRQGPVKPPEPPVPWWLPDSDARWGLIRIIAPVLIIVVVFVWVVSTGSRTLTLIMLSIPPVCVAVFFVKFRLQTNRIRDLHGSGSSDLTTRQLHVRIDDEVASAPHLPVTARDSQLITTLLWQQFGNDLARREGEVRAAAEEHDWSFTTFDTGATAALAGASVMPYTRSLCRNTCRGQDGQTPFVLSDLTWTRFNIEEFDRIQRVKLITATVCTMPFAAPQSLRIVDKRQPLASFYKRRSEARVESDDFNSRFFIVGRNNAWTRLVLNPVVIDLLLTSSISSLVIDGGRIAVLVEPWLPAGQFADLLKLCRHLRTSAQTAAAPDGEEPVAYFS